MTPNTYYWLLMGSLYEGKRYVKGCPSHNMGNRNRKGEEIFCESD